MRVPVRGSRNRHGAHLQRGWTRRPCGRSPPCHGMKIFYGANATIRAFPLSGSHIIRFSMCALSFPNRISTGIGKIQATPTLRGANERSRTATYSPNPLLPLDLHYSIRNVHPCHGCAPGCGMRSRIAQPGSESLLSRRLVGGSECGNRTSNLAQATGVHSQFLPGHVRFIRRLCISVLPITLAGSRK